MPGWPSDARGEGPPSRADPARRDEGLVLEDLCVSHLVLTALAKDSFETGQTRHEGSAAVKRDRATRGNLTSERR